MLYENVTLNEATLLVPGFGAMEMEMGSVPPKQHSWDTVGVEYADSSKGGSTYELRELRSGHVLCECMSYWHRGWCRHTGGMLPDYQRITADGVKRS